MELEASRLQRRRRSIGRLRSRALILTLVGYVFLARWWLLPLMPFNIGFWAAVGEEDFPLWLAPSLTLCTALLVFGVGRSHFGSLPFGFAPIRDGEEVTDPMSPLLAMVHGVRQRMRAPRIHRVTVADRTRGQLIVARRRGRVVSRTVVLGSEIFDVLDERGVAVVIAHEIAHARRSTGPVDVGVHREASAWSDLAERIEGVSAAPLLRWFLRWWTPKLIATSIAIAQSFELEADRRAADLFGAGSVCDTLMRLALLDEHLDDLDLALEPQGELALTQSFNAFLMSPKAADVLASLRDHEPRPVLDSHPSLCTRLAALGGSIGEALPPVVAPAGETLEDPVITRARRRTSEALASIQAFQTAAPDQMWPEEAFARAAMMEARDPRGALEAMLEASRGWIVPPAWAYLEMGRLRISTGDRAGLADVEQAMRDDPMLTADGCSIALDLLDPNDPAVPALETQLSEERELLLVFHRERAVAALEDPVVQHDLDDSVLDRLLKTLEGIPESEEAFVSRRVLRVRPEIDPVYLLAVKRTPGRFGLERHDADGYLQKRIAASLNVPHAFFVFAPGARDSCWRSITRGPWAPLVRTGSNDQNVLDDRSGRVSVHVRSAGSPVA